MAPLLNYIKQLEADLTLKKKYIKTLAKELERSIEDRKKLIDIAEQQQQIIKQLRAELEKWVFIVP